MFDKLDKKQKIELIVTGIGILILIYMLAGSSGKAQKKHATEEDKSAEPSLSLKISGNKKNIESLVKKDWGRDPFSFTILSEAESGLEGLILNGIVWDDQNPYAIINDEVVKPGDILRGMTVAEIKENAVILQENDQKHTLGLTE